MPLTQFQRHKLKWSDCGLCNLCTVRSHVVLLRGSVPAKVLFIGEAPGESEDALAKPFIGPVGKTMDHIIEVAGLKKGDYALSNVIACMPKDEEGKIGIPPVDSIEACAERLVECFLLVKPKLIVWVGDIASHYGAQILKQSPAKDTLTASMIHPGAIFKMHVAQRGLAIQRAIVTLAEAIEGVV